MPITGTALLIAIGVAVSAWGGSRLVHGVKKVTHAILHHHDKQMGSKPAAQTE